MFLEHPSNHKEQFGWIEVICGSMFSGKTEELIRRLKRAQLANKKIEDFILKSFDDKVNKLIVVTGKGPSASKVARAKNATVYTEAEYNKLLGK